MRIYSFYLSIVVFAFSFKTAKSLNGTHYIFTNQAKTCGVYISESLNICGADPFTGVLEG